MIRSLVLSGDRIHVLVDDAQKGEKVIREILKEQEMEIIDLLVVRPSLEDAFVSIIQGRERNNYE